MLKSKPNKKIAITLGDPTGVGPQLIASVLQRHPSLWDNLLVIGDENVFFQFWHLKKRPLFLHVKDNEQHRHIAGQPSFASGKDALCYLKTFVHLYQEKKVNALLTGPVSKEFIALSEKGFHGHTSWLAKQFHQESLEMLFVAKNHRLLLLSIHQPLKQVPQIITKKRIVTGITQTYHFLQNYISHPLNIAICGLNPHAGENGLMGEEEQNIIIPALRQLAKNKIKVQGPFPADTICLQHQQDNFDLLVSCYHDQLLPVFKTLYFDDLVNVTVGLPFLRTSPAHGTAFHLASSLEAKDKSMEAALLYLVEHL